MKESDKNDINTKTESKINEENLFFKTKIINNNNVFLLDLEIKENKLIMRVTDTDAIGNGLYKSEWSKEDLDKIFPYFKSFDNINEIFKKIKFFIIEKKYSLEFDENITKLKITFDSIIFDQKTKIILELNKEEMSDKDIINQLCEKVKLLNINLSQNNSKVKNNLDSNIILNEDEYNMISDQIEEKTKHKIVRWEKIFTSSSDGDSAESFHSKCDGIENTVVLVKTKKYKRFGGFTKNKWNHNNGGFSNDSKAFLFSLNTMDIFNRNDNGCEMQGNKAFGPWFGGGPDFQIANNCFKVNSVHNKKCYNYPQNSSYPLAESSSFLVKEYEVYKIIFEQKTK